MIIQRKQDTVILEKIEQALRQNTVQQQKMRSSISNSSEQQPDQHDDDDSSNNEANNNDEVLGNNTGAAVPADCDNTYADDSNNKTHVPGVSVNSNEDILHILAPSGKLGLAIDIIQNETVVFIVQNSSSLVGKVQVGDKLVAVDNEDVRTLTISEVLKLLSQKSTNPLRKLTILRTKAICIVNPSNVPNNDESLHRMKEIHKMEIVPPAIRIKTKMTPNNNNNNKSSKRKRKCSRDDDDDDKEDKSNEGGDDDDNNCPREIHHQTPTTQSRRSRKKSPYNNNENNNNMSTKHEEADEIDDDYKEEEEEEEDPRKDNNDVRNHQKEDRRYRKKDKMWMGMFEKLKAYKKQHKHTLVPTHYEKDPRFGHWISTQRQLYRKEDLDPNRVDLLKSIGFDWKVVRGGKVDNERWMGMFEKLVVYQKQHNNTLVPTHYEKDPKFGAWISTQRQAYKKEDLDPKRVDLLNSIGFKWVADNSGGKVDNEKWRNMYQKLVVYQKLHKNTAVPRKYEKDPQLGQWVSNQRQNYKNDALQPGRFDLLNSINFIWEVENRNQLWMGMFEKLVEYKKEHNNTRVQCRYEKDPKLGEWVSKQRNAYKNDKLLPKRLVLLKSIDFT